MTAINLWFFFYLVKSFSFSLFSRFYVDCLTCNMACMGLFYPFPLCSVCCFPMFSTPYHSEYHSSPFCRRFYIGEHPQSWPQVQLVLARVGAGWRCRCRRGEVVTMLKPGAEGEASWKKREVLGLGLSWGIRPNPILALVLGLSWSPSLLREGPICSLC